VAEQTVPAAAVEGQTVAHTEAPGTVEHHVEPSAFGISMLTPGFFVALATIVVLAILLRARVPALIAKALDTRIDGIREQLDQAAKLRAEAEALRDEYTRKSKEAAVEIVAMKEAAAHQANEIVEKAKRDSVALIARRQAMAEDKIASTERAAIEQVRVRVAEVATAAARELIAAKHGAEEDSKLVDQSIARF
jgi:F-type H+-transporting ATPase subunit b